MLLAIRIPVVAVVGTLLLIAYSLGATATQTVSCQRLAPGQVYCQVTQARPLSGVLAPAQPFQLQDMTISSELCDNTPQGGVRFCHRLTLLGDQGSVTLPEVRTPLSAATVIENLRSFIAGEGGTSLVWATPKDVANPLRMFAIGILFTIAAWGFWDVRWPPLPTSPLAIDGTGDLGTHSKKG
ncbi:MAG: hypothetical protein ACFCVD_18630 [Nodosilinea sp.]